MIECCINCENFYMCDGCHGYSEWTPGYPPEMECKAGHFVMGVDDFKNAIRKLHDVMENGCEDFEPYTEES